MNSFPSNHSEDLIAILLIKDSINQSNFYVKVNLFISGLDLKKEIENQTQNLEAQYIRLVFNGKLLSDYFSLYQQGIKNSSVVYLIPQKVQTENDQVSNESNVKKPNTQLLHVFHVSKNYVRTRNVRLFLKSTISKLDSAFTSNSIYIYHGIILDKTKTFDYYNIINESTIVFIPEDLSKTNPMLLDKWLKLTDDTDRFQYYVDSKTKKTCSRESSRLSDLSYNNLELKMKAYRSVFNENRISTFTSNYQNQNPQSTTNYTSSTSEISESPLPKIFA